MPYIFLDRRFITSNQTRKNNPPLVHLLFILTLRLLPPPCFYPNNFLVTHTLPLLYLSVMCEGISWIFFYNSNINCYSGVRSNYKCMARKVVIIMSWGMFLTTHFNWNVNLECQALILVGFWSLLVCYSIVSTLIYCPIVMPPFILCRLISQFNAVIKNKYYHPLNFVWFLNDPSFRLLVLSYHISLGDNYVQFWKWSQEDSIYQGMF